jgi:hypothetical protein
MLKALTAALLFTGCASALSTLAGMVQTGTGTPVDGAKLTVRQAATGRSFETTSRNGRYSFVGLPPRDFILDIAKDGMARAFAAVRMTGNNDDHELGFVLVQVLFGSPRPSRRDTQCVRLPRDLKGLLAPQGSSPHTFQGSSQHTFCAASFRCIRLQPSAPASPVRW